MYVENVLFCFIKTFISFNKIKIVYLLLDVMIYKR